MNDEMEIEHSHANYSPTGLCPLCGVEVEEHFYTEESAGGYEVFDAMYQTCPCCDWQSEVLYE